MRPVFFASFFILTALLAACGSDDTQQSTEHRASTEQLPAPAGKTGGVTGMPAHPGPGPVGPPAPTSPDVAVDETGNPVLPESTSAEGAPAPGDVAAEPTPDDAVTVIRDYYAAINRGEFARAHALWADGGRASGQSPEQFAAGFADTTGVSVEVMPPGRVDPAAGSRFIEVPVAITATQRDGSQRKYAGAYVLRRGVVDGATPEQRAWRIGSADIREVQP